MVFESMMAHSLDEFFTLYELLADHIEINDERTEITFHLNPDARFSDGTPVTQDDVLFTCDLLKKKGRPPFDRYMKRIASVEKNRQPRRTLPSCRAGRPGTGAYHASVIPVLPGHAVNPDTFEQMGLTAIPGSSPYVIEKAESGQRIIYRRNLDYWVRNLAVNRWLNNFEQVQIESFRNDNAHFECV